MKNQNIALLWFLNDLRLEDNPALKKAASYDKVIPLYIADPDHEIGQASKSWLHRSLEKLDEQLKKKGSGLVLEKGYSLDVLVQYVKDYKVNGIFWNRRYTPKDIKRDQKIKAQLTKLGLEVESFNGSLLREPWEVLKKDGTPFLVYSAYWRNFIDNFSPSSKMPCSIPPRPTKLKPQPLKTLDLLPKPRWDQKIFLHWQVGSQEAQKKLLIFSKAPITNYDDLRNKPALHGTSRLSPHLRFGEISPSTIWCKIEKKWGPPHSKQNPGVMQYYKELVWREFSYYLLFHYPRLVSKPLREKFESFPWQKNTSFLRCWQQGQTGYPMVDAGMRELYATGWMHNRVRMITASFLVKHLLIHWSQGAHWFFDCLVDGDMASNIQGWQWVAGSGADASPYFRIFNPILQGEKYDPHQQYVKKWCPELSNLSPKYLHSPWTAPKEVLQAAGVVLGQNYPKPIVDHDRARKKALSSYRSLS